MDLLKDSICAFSIGDVVLGYHLLPTAASLTLAVGNDYSWGSLITRLNDVIVEYLERLPR